jgi:hypothetical protein
LAFYSFQNLLQDNRAAYLQTNETRPNENKWEIKEEPIRKIIDKNDRPVF